MSTFSELLVKWSKSWKPSALIWRQIRLRRRPSPGAETSSSVHAYSSISSLSFSSATTQHLSMNRSSRWRACSTSLALRVQTGTRAASEARVFCPIPTDSAQMSVYRDWKMAAGFLQVHLTRNSSKSWELYFNIHRRRRGKDRNPISPNTLPLGVVLGNQVFNPSWLCVLRFRAPQSRDLIWSRLFAPELSHEV